MRKLWVVVYQGLDRRWHMPDWLPLEEVVHATREEGRDAKYKLGATLHSPMRVVPYVPQEGKR